MAETESAEVESAEAESAEAESAEAESAEAESAEAESAEAESTEAETVEPKSVEPKKIPELVEIRKSQRNRPSFIDEDGNAYVCHYTTKKKVILICKKSRDVQEKNLYLKENGIIEISYGLGFITYKL